MLHSIYKFIASLTSVSLTMKLSLQVSNSAPESLKQS